MKIFAFIMAFLVLAMSAMPCADEELPSGNRLNTEITKALHNHGDQQPDDCSPFCHCTCCAGFSINHFITSVNSIPTHQNSLTTSFLSLEVIEIALPIWQPPQLV